MSHSHRNQGRATSEVAEPRGTYRPVHELMRFADESGQVLPLVTVMSARPATGKCVYSCEALRALHDVEFGRIEVVIAGGKVKRIIPSYDLRESDSES